MIDARETDGFVAIATQGNGMYSTHFDPSLSVSELPHSQNAKIKNYPNPFQNQTTIEYKLSRKGNVNLNLLDVNGSLIKHLFNGQQQKGIHTFQLNASGLSPGMYFVAFEHEGLINYHKILINN